MKTTTAGPSVPRDERHSLRLRLRRELAARCSRNPRYSLRAFARDLGIDHSTLSQVLRGRRRLTEATIRRLAAGLRLDDEATERHVASEPLLTARERPTHGRSARLARDAAAILGDWLPGAILELVRLREFRPDSRWIARVLDVPVDAVNVALQRLLRLGLLEMRAPDRWEDRSGGARADLEDLPAAVVRALSARLAERRAESLADPGRGARLYRASTLAVAAADLPDVLRELAELHRRLAERLDRAHEPDRVYRLELALFPLTHETERDDG